MTARSAAALAVVLLLAGCGGGHSTRDALRAYIEKVNAVELSMRAPLLAVDRADRHFSTSPVSLPAERPKLVRSQRTLDRLTARLRALDPPAPARRLHRLLVSLAADEAGLAAELVHVATFLPPYRAAVQPLQSVNQQLQQRLTGKRTSAEEATALAQYAADLQPELAALARLQPPPLFAPSYRTQVATLQLLRRSALALAAGLRRHETKRLRALTAAFSAAARSGASITAQRAQIAAVRGFDARQAALATLAMRIERERARLDKLP